MLIRAGYFAFCFLPMNRQLIKDYFTFSRKERTGIIVLLLLISFCMLATLLLPWLFPEKMFTDKFNWGAADTNRISSILKKATDTSQKKWSYPYNYNTSRVAYNNSKNDKPSSGSLFHFDPNLASTDAWRKLGIKEPVIATIQHYLAKGGKFRQAEDLAKVWGLHREDFERLKPYIQIENPTTVKKEETTIPTKNSLSFKKSNHPIDINLADTAEWMNLSGIGNKLANRIVAFREKLGGFYSTEQVGETFALPDSTFMKIKSLLVLHETRLKKLNINTASIEQLKSHPYIRFVMANAILQYRTQHGHFSDIAELKKIMVITEQQYNKIIPYLSVAD